MTPREATVLWGANNIFTVRTDDGTVFDHIRIKGKILVETDNAYNPLAPGDRVLIHVSDRGSVVIVRRFPRINAVSRWNRKRRSMQTIAANIDHLYLVTSALQPRYRPHFVDRVLAMTELEHIPTSLIVNKSDFPLDPVATEHLRTLQFLGYDVLYTVANPDAPVGIEKLANETRYGTVVFFGQSGVGKSSLINILVPGADQETGDISLRFNRGRHTTTLARQVIAGGGDSSGGGRVFIDTPGIREYALDQYTVTEIAAGFREFRRYIQDCRMPSCTHLHEPGCAVRAALETNDIPLFRYESYAKIVNEMAGSSV